MPEVKIYNIRILHMIVLFSLSMQCKVLFYNLLFSPGGMTVVTHLLCRLESLLMGDVFCPVSEMSTNP